MVTLQIPKHIKTYFEENEIKPDICKFIEYKLSKNEKVLYDLFMKMRFDKHESHTVDFDYLWKYLEYASKQKAKENLVSNFIPDVEYKILLNFEVEQLHGGHGHNKEHIYLTVDAAQKFAMRAQTAKGKEVSLFFVKMLKIIQEYQLLCGLYEQRQISKLSTEKGILSVMTHGKKTIYIGDVGVINGNRCIKAGCSDGLTKRVTTLKRIFPNGFVLIFALEHNDNREIEKRFFAHPEIRCNQIGVELSDGTISRETIKLDQHLTEQRCIEIMKEVANDGYKFNEISLETKKIELKQMETMLEFVKYGVSIESLLQTGLFATSINKYQDTPVVTISTPKSIILPEEEQIRRFLAECIEPSNQNILIVHLYLVYRKWCNDKNIGEITKKIFLQKLHELGYNVSKNVRIPGRAGPQLGLTKRFLTDYGIQLQEK